MTKKTTLNGLAALMKKGFATLDARMEKGFAAGTTTKANSTAPLTGRSIVRERSGGAPLA